MMENVFIVDDRWRFARVVACTAFFHGLVLLGSVLLPSWLWHTPSDEKRRPTLFEITHPLEANLRSPKLALHIAPRAHDSSILQTAESHLSSPLASPTAPSMPTLRRRVVSAAAHAAADAAYLDRWQNYVEQYGNAHYPSTVLNNNLQGNLRLLVAINRDGSLRDVIVRRSSGSSILDEAAVNIVKQAAPFDPLPPEIAKNTDILEIIRTWQFRGTLSTFG